MDEVNDTESDKSLSTLEYNLEPKDLEDGESPKDIDGLVDYMSCSSSPHSLFDNEAGDVDDLTEMLKDGMEFSTILDSTSHDITPTADTPSTSRPRLSFINDSRNSMNKSIIEIKEKYATATDGIAALKNLSRPLDEELVSQTEALCAELDKLLEIDCVDVDGLVDKEELALHLKTESEVVELFDESLKKTSAVIVNPETFLKKMMEPTGDILTSPYFDLPCVSRMILLAESHLMCTMPSLSQEQRPRQEKPASQKRNIQRIQGEVEKESQLKSMNNQEAELERVIDQAYVNNAHNALLDAYKELENPVEYWSFVMNPSSFSQTAKNMFDISCLAQAGKLRMLVEYDTNDEHGKQVKSVHLVPLTQKETEQFLLKYGDRTPNAISMRLTSSIYNEKKLILGLSAPRITPVDEVTLARSFFQSSQKKK